jgi:hypothetical protein
MSEDLRDEQGESLRLREMADPLADWDKPKEGGQLEEDGFGEGSRASWMG